jgi:putative glutamine amidotransferase
VKRPVVGITQGAGRRKGYHALREDYARSVERAGAVPVLLPTAAPELAGEMLERLDGLVLSGGVDVDPALYGATAHPRLGSVDRARDEFELALTRIALEREMPLLAICRGLQLLNVAAGGTLVQDIPSLVTGAAQHDAPGRRTRRSHAVEVVPGSKLSEILGPGPLLVNSFHHQAIDRLGAGLRVSARCAADSVIEAVELQDHAFAVAVQWHPESFWREAESFHALFAAHASACLAMAPVQVR